jgi:hypothetical protein
MVLLVLGTRLLAPAWLVVPFCAYVALVILHDRTTRRRAAAERIVRFYEGGLARLDGAWAGRGVTGDRFQDPLHPYADDLDLFGRGSLFELLCLARTRAGEETLASWLRAPADAAVVRARQAAVEELRSRVDLRERLALHGEEVRAGVDVDALVAWGEAPVTLTSRGTRLAGGVLAACAVGAVGIWVGGMGYAPLVAIVLIQQLFLAPVRARVGAVTRSVDQPARDLAVFSHLLECVEGEAFTSPLLRELTAGLASDGTPPSRRLARLGRLVALLHSQRNGVFAVAGILLLWPMQLAFAIEGWRAECGGELARWIRITAELEALSSLAGYAYEHPDDPFPELLDSGACLDGQGLAHPLLPAAAAVRNEVALGEEVRLLIVSGSNMSGKSTLLRTIGTNVVLALAGAPVRAHRLRLTPLSLGASLRVQDSLQTGTSRFYAEVKRLRQIVDLTEGGFPLLFLLDEILNGTNSHDRRIGAEAVVRGLIRNGAIGLVTTHDLALTRMAEDPVLHAVNGHFQDDLTDGAMSFDYHLRPGVVEKSNALELMRAVGLEV